jgi:hypothetical protein
MVAESLTPPFADPVSFQIDAGADQQRAAAMLTID